MFDELMEEEDLDLLIDITFNSLETQKRYTKIMKQNECNVSKKELKKELSKLDNIASLYAKLLILRYQILKIKQTAKRSES